MTKISYINGIAGMGEREAQERALNIPQKAYINYGNMTTGEVDLYLMQQQLNLFSSYYPENKSYKKAHDLAENILYRGMHTALNDFNKGILSSEEKKILQIAKIKAKHIKPAIRGRKKVSRATKTGINSDLITSPDCEQLLKDIENELSNHWRENNDQWEDHYGNSLAPNFEAQALNSFEYKECINAKAYIDILNDKLESSSNYFLYAFLSQAEADKGGSRLINKETAHKSTIEILSHLTGLSESNLKNWLRLGTIRNNVKGGLGTATPEKNIQWFKENGGNELNEAGIGIDPLTVTAILKLIPLIVAAVGSTLALINNIKNSEPTASDIFNSQVPCIGTSLCMPENSDWTAFRNQQQGYGPLDQLSNDFNNNNLLITGGAALLIYSLL